MHGSLKDWVTGKLESLPGEILDLNYVDTLKRAFLSGDQVVNAKVWNLVCFNLWFREIYNS
jgi:hypothetical protein